jgi:hypothetical protein
MVRSRRPWDSGLAGGHVRKGDEGRGRQAGHAAQDHGAQPDAGIRAKEMAPDLGGDAAEVETDEVTTAAEPKAPKASMLSTDHLPPVKGL